MDNCIVSNSCNITFCNLNLKPLNSNVDVRTISKIGTVRNQHKDKNNYICIMKFYFTNVSKKKCSYFFINLCKIFENFMWKYCNNNREK